MARVRVVDRPRQAKMTVQIVGHPIFLTLHSHFLDSTRAKGPNSGPPLGVKVAIQRVGQVALYFGGVTNVQLCNRWLRASESGDLWFVQATGT